MTILYLGDSKQTSTANDRASALRRCGHIVIQKDPVSCLTRKLAAPLMGRFHYRTGFRFVVGDVRVWLENILGEIDEKPDLIWINGGQYFSPECLQVLRSLKVPVVLYNNDDPTGGRDPGCWNQLLRSLPLYDLCVSLRKPTVSEMLKLGAPKTLRVWMSYDEVQHAPLVEEEADDPAYASSIAFVGTWMRHEARHIFLKQLLDAGLEVRIWGDRWQKCGDRDLIARCWAGKRASGRDYVRAIAGAKICLGLLSKGNRDLHTRRSVEIPFSGGLLCAERTEEHLMMYDEDREAVFWNTAEECIEQCNRYLEDGHTRNLIKAAGMKKIRQLHLGNEDVCRYILECAFSSSISDHSEMPLPY